MYKYIIVDRTKPESTYFTYADTLREANKEFEKLVESAKALYGYSQVSVFARVEEFEQLNRVKWEVSKVWPS